MGTQNEQEAFLWLQGRMVELLLRHDVPRFSRTFGERRAALFDDARHAPLRPYRELAVLFFLRDELFGAILPRIKRRLSFLAPRELVAEELPPRGRIDWPRTLAAGLRDRPGEPPLTVQTRQRRRHFATPENLLTVATILAYRNVVQHRLDAEADSDAGQALRHPLREIVDSCTRELAFPQFTGLVRACERIVDGYAEQTTDELEQAVAAQLLPGRNSAYDDLIAWRRQLAALRLLDRDGAVAVPPMLGADPTDDNYLYQLWLFYEIGELLQRRGQVERWDIHENELVFHWGDGEARQQYLLRHDRAIARHWDKAPGVRPDLYIVRTDRRSITDPSAPPEEQLVWHDPGYVLDAKYYKPRGSRRAPGDTVKRMIADLHLTGERHGALLFAFQRDEHPRNAPDDEADQEPNVDQLVQHAAPLYTVQPGVAAAQTSVPDVQVAVWRVRPAIGAEQEAHRILAALLERVHQALGVRHEVRCHGVFLDTLSAIERDGLRDRSGAALVAEPAHNAELVACPKPHIGPWRVDLVRRDVHCLRDPRLCHIIQQVGARPPVRPPRTINDLLHELSDLFARTPAEDLDDAAASEVARRVMALSRRFAEISGGLKRLATYEAHLRTYGMGKTLDLLGPAERESLALAVFLVEQINEVGARDYSAPTIHVASVLELEVQRRLLAVPNLTRAAFQHGRPTFGTLGYMRANPHRTGGDWACLTSFLASHWIAPVDPDDPGRSISFDNFVSFMDQARHVRNLAAHTSPVSQDAYGRFFLSVCQSGALRIGALNVLLLAWT